MKRTMPLPPPLLLTLALPLVLALATATTAHGQDAAAAAPAPAADASTALANQLIWLLYTLAGVVVMLVLATLVLVDYLYKSQFGRSIFPSVSLPFLQWSWLAGLKPARATGKFDEDLGHDYDGISELDNSAPPLFNYILYGTIAFAVVYLLNYHVLGTGESQEQEYLAGSNELDTLRARAASLAANKVDENSVVRMTDATALAAGQATFNQYCATCHRTDGGGNIGPNLTDDYWLHGNTVQAVFKTIKYGVPAKGMIAWQAQLSPAQMAEVTSYLLTLHGTNPPNPKAPEGERLGSPIDGAPTTPTDSSKATPAAATSAVPPLSPQQD